MENKTNLRVAVVGCGCISVMHVNALLQLENVTLCACVDVVEERAQKFAQQYGCIGYTDYEEMLYCEKPDVVHICTPHAQHLPMIALAVEKGCHVFTEKPPCVNREELKQLLKLEEKGRIGVCFQNRFNDSVQAILSLIEKGETGKPLGARAFVTWKRNEDYYAAAPWRGKLDIAAGGSLINQSIHTLDLLVQFLGTPQAVSASMANHHLTDVIEVEDTMEGVIAFPDCRAIFYASNAYCTDAKVWVELCFEHMTINMKETELEIQLLDGTVKRQSFAPAQTQGKSYWGTSHTKCIAAYYDALRSGKEFSIEPKAVEDTMRATLAMYESAKAHKTIIL